MLGGVEGLISTREKGLDRIAMLYGTHANADGERDGVMRVLLSKRPQSLSKDQDIAVVNACARRRDSVACRSAELCYWLSRRTRDGGQKGAVWHGRVFW